MATLLILASIGSLFVGAISIDAASLAGPADSLEVRTFVLSRVPRLLAILCTGAGMSVAGLIMQQLCMNRFVSPTTGATIQSAQFGVLLSLVLLPGLGLWGRTLLAFVTAVLGTWAFIAFVQRIRFKDTALVPLVGIMFGNVIGGVTSFLAFKFEVTQQLSSYLVGSFSLVTKGNYELVWLAVPLVALAFAFANHFNIVGMGRDFSQNLGVNHNLVLFLGLTIAAMVSAAVVSVVGSISYIGLLVPNIVSLFKGDKIRGTLADTALFGALFVLGADVVARSVIAPYELPIELVVGVLGSALFIALLLYRLKNGRRAVKTAGVGARLKALLSGAPVGADDGAPASDEPAPAVPAVPRNPAPALAAEKGGPRG